ncbi:MAG: cation-translocating P-type ATPase [Eubacterium sp.]|nr:cation-translocating P-type ATPase [Eubacterium sp.]
MSSKKQERFMANPEFGLTDEQVAQQEIRGLMNTKVDSSTQTTKEIIYSNVFTYFNFIFIVLSALLIMVGAFNNLTFLPVIISNTLIGIVQELRSKKVLDELSILNAPHSVVIRNGKKKKIDAEKLVRDDIVIFSAGNQIPADATILHGTVNVNESLITGEADEVCKKYGDELLSGSFIVSGKCVARLDKVGESSYISQLTLEATKSKKHEQSEMIRALDKLVKIIGVAIIPIGSVLFFQQYVLQDNSLKASVTGMVAAVIGMIPEGLYLLASIALVVSAMRLAKQQVLLHDMKCIETLARVDVLCVDKTGTITVPDMEVSGIYMLNGTTDYDEQTCKQLLNDFSAAMTADNATMEAMKKFFTEPIVHEADQVVSFSSERKYSAVTFHDVPYLLGAPEFLLLDRFPEYEEEIKQFSNKGYRVLVFGTFDGEFTGKRLHESITPICLVYLSNAIRSGAVDTFSYFEECGVVIKVISGDNPATVSEIAQKAGIAHAKRYIDASTLTTQEDIESAVRHYTVFGRVTPDQKQLFVNALQQQGHTVAMTGDGVNDVLALKDADCSIAMASGSDAAANVAQLVLLDSDFSRMPSVVLEGRRVVNNIQRSASLFLVKNIFSLLMAIFSMAFMFSYPLEPSQISLISVFTIGIPSFVLALEPNKNRIQGKFLTNVFLKALPAGLTDFFVVAGLVYFCKEFNVDAHSVSTCCTILLAIVGFMILYLIARPMTKIHWALLISMIIGWLICMLFIGKLFSITDITRQCTMLLLVFALVTEPLIRYLNKFCEFLLFKIEKRHQEKLQNREEKNYNH